MNDLETKTLARLRRFPIWTERSRGGDYVTLEAVGRSGDIIQDSLSLSALNGLLSAGLIKHSTQQRIMEDLLRGNPKPHEVTQHYWSVVE